MSASLPRYPATQYGPIPLVDLASRAERERLSRAALKGFFNLVDKWRVRDEDARALLGGLSNGPYYTWKKKPNRLLDSDVLTRISYLIGIFKALNVLYGQKLADEWVCLQIRTGYSAGKHRWTTCCAAVFLPCKLSGVFLTPGAAECECRK